MNPGKRLVGFILALAVLLGGVGGVAVIVLVTVVNCGVLLISPVDEIEDVVEDTKDNLSDLFFDLFADEEQKIRKANAAVIVKVGEERGFSQYSIAIAVATSIQETNLENRPYNKNGQNDHDSLGLFQQRPSQGWGTPEQIMDPEYASNKFYDRLQLIPDRDSRPMIDVAIQIQNPSRSAYERRWDWDEVALEIVKDNYKGDGKVGDNCTAGHAEGEWQKPFPDGEYCITSRFGDTAGRKNTHMGVDFSCNAGDPIHAIAAGKIVLARLNGAYGYNVIIDHGGGVSSSYGHMVEGSIPANLTPGTQVSAGQVIGEVGNTGRSYGAHLHLEIYLDGKYYDPAKFLKDKGLPIE